MKMKNAFTMIELVFIIVILGILAAVAFPKFGGNIESAKIAKGKAAVSAIRTAIANERQGSLIRGAASYPADLDAGAANGVHSSLFTLLGYPLYSKASSGDWMKTTNVGVQPAKYNFYMTSATTVNFDYNSTTGTFDCNHGTANCRSLAE